MQSDPFGVALPVVELGQQGVRCNMARSTGSRVKLEREGGRRERTRTHKLRSTVSGRDGPALVLEGRGTIS